jgi:predicted PurR-regulated permease PerM
MQNNRWLQTLIVLLVIIASTWLAGQVWSFLIQFTNIFMLFFFSWLLAFILRPLARWLTERGLPYTVSVMLVYLALALVFTLGGFLLVPVVSDQVSRLIAEFPSYQNEIARMVADGQKTLLSWGVKEVDLNKFYTDLAGQVQTVVLSVLQNTFSVLQSVATLALQLILVLLLSFYFMKDGDKLFGGVMQMLPPTWQDEVRLAGLSIEKSFGGFIRGQLVFALVYALLTAVVMIMPPFQLDYIVLASIVAGLCMIIPLVGNLLAFIPPMLVCVVNPDKADMWAWLLLALFIMQSLMMNVLGPRIMSSAIGIHPLYVMAAILIGSQVAGIWGALFGIPIAGAINLIGRPLMRRIRHQTSLYQAPSTPSLATSAFLTGPLSAALVDAQLSPAGVNPGTAREPLSNAPPASTPAPAPPQPERATRPYAASAPELDDDLVFRPSPTLSARAWRVLFNLLSRVRTWAWARVQARVTRH